MTTFTAQHADRSNHTGYQFEFYCDRCRAGHMSSFQSSKIGMAEGFLRAAGGMFGGTVGRIASAGDNLKEAFRGPARDAAFKQAVEEGKKHFKQCAPCTKWVCPQCWNAEQSKCKVCATEAKAGAPATAKCPHCSAATAPGAKFCPECGKPTPAIRTACPKCSAKVTPGAKFCPECGEKLV